MSAIYDNWERLVAAVLKKQQLWELFHQHSRSPSLLSEASDLSCTSFSLSSHLDYQDLDFSSSSRFVSKLILISDFSPAFDVKDAYVVSTELLVGGTLGSVYAITIDNGAKFVVKRLISTNLSEQDFKSYMDIIGDVTHMNVVPLRAYYSSLHERIMLYDYYRNGSMYSLLHGQTDDNRAHVDWETRLKIAIGAARGIAKIHTQLGGMLVHGNIKASNVFINQQSYGCVSDFGLTSMTNTTFSPTARCSAPEIKNTQTVTHASDVYSFGILLLELLTRKSSAHVPGGPVAVDLVKLVNLVKSKDRAAKVFDVDLLMYPSIRDQMVKMLLIGIRCVEKSIKKRPKMFEVVKMLEDIHPLNPTSQVSLRNKLIFLEDADPTFELEDLLSASAEVLGEGTFGTSYLARLENGIITVAKRLKNDIFANKDFQQHAEILGRMRHKNVDGLRAYYFSKDEKILVHDYFYQSSLSALLYGKQGLNWEIRLETAVGAARGIAHIHKQAGRKFVHGNIKSSNIFVNGQNYGIVSDAGLTQFIDPIHLPNVFYRVYLAPEIRITRKVSQASDVYSFGVVLLELVSGNSLYIAGDGGVTTLVKWAQFIFNNERVAQLFDVGCRTDDNEEAMEQVLQIAMDCVSIDPKDRPIMPTVVKALEEISGVEQSNSFESELEYLLEDLLRKLTY